jgi:DNA-binding NarL/FixJ family response regulator/pimeloyl-ACP methyl ester carboxylesterase
MSMKSTSAAKSLVSATAARFYDYHAENTEKPKVRIVIADDHPIVLVGLKKLLLDEDFDVVGEASDGIEVLERVQGLDPDILLLNLRMPNMDGLAALKVLQQTNKRTRVIMLTASEDRKELVQAMKLGCSAIVLKRTAPELIVTRIRTVTSGEVPADSNTNGPVTRPFSKGLEGIGLSSGAKERMARPLSARARDLIALVAQGCTNKEMAKKMLISEQTVKNHLHSIFDRLGVSDRLELALYAIHNGLHLPAGEGPAARDVKSVLLVHGGWANSSSWSKVIPLLEAKGLSVVAVQLPLTSLAADVAAVNRALALEQGPVLLVGHSYGGAVITEAGNDPKVAGLLYVAAVAPDQGESALGLINSVATPASAELRTDRDGFLTLTPKGIAQDFAQGLSAREIRVLVATQAPIHLAAMNGTIGVPAWKSKPTWFVVAGRDRTISPDLEATIATKISATTLTIPTCHVVMLTEPAKVSAFIAEATAQAGHGHYAGCS